MESIIEKNVTAKFLDGTTQEVKQSDIEEFIIQNIDKLATKQINVRRIYETKRLSNM